jgi:hypothetical protein
MAEVTHNDIPAMPGRSQDYLWRKTQLTPKISSEKLASHGTDHWLTPNMDYHPFFPALPFQMTKPPE